MTLFVRAAAISRAAIICVIDAPTDGSVTMVGATLQISGTISRPGTVVAKKTIGATTTVLGAADVDGDTFTYSYEVQAEDEGTVTFGAIATAAIGGSPVAASGVTVTIVSGYPATLPSLALWLSGAQQAYSDAGTTLATVPYGRVQQIAQPAPLTGNWTASGTRPWREVNGFDFHYNASDAGCLIPPAFATTQANNCTIGFSFEHRIGQGGSFPLRGNLIGLLVASQTFYLSTLAGYGSFGPTLPYGVSQVSLVITSTPSGIAIDGMLNGVPFTASRPAVAAGALASLLVGQYAHCAISQFVLTSAALDSTQRADLLAYLVSNTAQHPPASAPLVVQSGDSLTAGWNAGCQIALDGNATPPRWVNTGVSGAQCPTIAGFYSAQVAPLYSPSRAKNIIVCAGISVNDLQLVLTGTAAARAAAALVNYYAYCDMVKADGWTVVVCTMTPASLASRPQDFEPCRQIMNTDIRANYLAHGHYLLDMGGVPGMATLADTAGPNFADGVHFSSAGYALQTAALLPVIEAALAA